MRINVYAINTDLKMQMCAKCMTRCSGESDYRALSHNLARGNIDLTEMGVQGYKSISVINLDYISITIIITTLCHCYNSGCSRVDRIALVSSNINTKMGRGIVIP